MTCFERASDGRARVVGSHDPRGQMNGFGGVVYTLAVGEACYRDALSALGRRHRRRIEVVTGPCTHECEWCGGID